jgi:hypothetical protein
MSQFLHLMAWPHSLQKGNWH